MRREPHPIGITGKPPHLTTFSCRRLLLTCGYRHEPYGQRACVSYDGGRSWNDEKEIILRDDAPNGDLGYSASVELDDGSILTVYYQQENAEEQTCLMTTKWELRL